MGKRKKPRKPKYVKPWDRNLRPLIKKHGGDPVP